MPVAAVARRDAAPPIAAAEGILVAGPPNALEGVFWPEDIAVCEGRRRRMLAGVRSVKRAGEQWAEESRSRGEK